jgi:hypothetical protein
VGSKVCPHSHSNGQRHGRVMRLIGRRRKAADQERW